MILKVSILAGLRLCGKLPSNLRGQGFESPHLHHFEQIKQAFKLASDCRQSPKISLRTFFFVKKAEIKHCFV